eukprot:Gb_21288 [translate_table: standard]
MLRCCGNFAIHPFLLKLIVAPDYGLSLKGTVRLIFQPAEEGGAGAAHMIKEHALGDAEAIFGMHVEYSLPTGTIATRPGPVFAATAIFEATIDGKGGHAAFPHMNVDPIVAASFAILSLQELISRESDPLDSQEFDTMKKDALVAIKGPDLAGEKLNSKQD